MDIKTIFCNATDGIKLSGLIYKANISTKKIVISVHGMATNCLKIRDEKIAEKLNQINIDLLVFNNRGHDLINYISKEIDGKKQKVLSGTSYEEISECYYDIIGIINYVISLGYEEIYLMGHSLGCTKTIYTYNKLLEENKRTIINKIRGIILLSLVDIPTTLQFYLKDNFGVMVTYAKNMKKENMENSLMPKESFIHPISVKTFLRYAIDNKDIDFARFSEKDYDFKEINNIKVPLFMRWGNDRELILQKTEELCENLKTKITNANLDIGFIDKANHSYSEKEEILANQIKEFLIKNSMKKD